MDHKPARVAEGRGDDVPRQASFEGSCQLDEWRFEGGKAKQKDKFSHRKKGSEQASGPKLLGKRIRKTCSNIGCF